MNELTISRVTEIIELARNVERESGQGERNLGIPFPEGWDRERRPGRHLLVASLREMTPVELAEVTALMWLGADLATNSTQFPSFVVKAKTESHPVEYVASKPLTRYLARGLQKLSSTPG